MLCIWYSAARFWDFETDCGGCCWCCTTKGEDLRHAADSWGLSALLGCGDTDAMGLYWRASAPTPLGKIFYSWFITDTDICQRDLRERGYMVPLFGPWICPVQWSCQKTSTTHFPTSAICTSVVRKSDQSAQSWSYSYLTLQKHPGWTRWQWRWLYQLLWTSS